MSDHHPSRRAMLALTGSAGAALLAGCLGSALPGDADESTTTPTSSPQAVPYGLSNANGYDGPQSAADATGRSAVTVDVGVGSGGLAFDPVAVHVDPGTTITWRWRWGNHDVVATAGAEFSSEIKSGGTFVWQVPHDASGLVEYECEPHAGQGMRGALAVGAAVPTATPRSSRTDEPTDAPPGHTPEPTSQPWDDDFGGWLAETPRYDGTVVDATGEASVSVAVGDERAGLGFSPPAVRDSPGTAVRWEWQSAGHDVVATAGAAFASDIESDGSFEWTAPDEETAVKYHCAPHSAQGERGVVVG